MGKDFWGTELPAQYKAKPVTNPYKRIQSDIPKISKKRKVCCGCGTKFIIEYDQSKPLVEYILCPACRSAIVP